MHIHILGICGTFMGSLAVLAKELGHRVTGSDRNVYPPMSTQLAALGVDVIEGYEPDQLALEAFRRALHGDHPYGRRYGRYRHADSGSWQTYSTR